MSRKVNPNKMSPSELDEYVKNLPEELPPRKSSALWSFVMAILSIVCFCIRVSNNSFSVLTWVMLGSAIILIASGIYILYRISTFNKS